MRQRLPLGVPGGGGSRQRPPPPNPPAHAARGAAGAERRPRPARPPPATEAPALGGSLLPTDPAPVAPLLEALQGPRRRRAGVRAAQERVGALATPGPWA